MTTRSIKTYRSTVRGDTVNAINTPGSIGVLLLNGESLETDIRTTENEMIAAQLGFHYTKFRDRFIFSSDFRAFAGGNFQCSKFNNLYNAVEYDGDDEGSGRHTHLSILQSRQATIRA